MENYNVTITGQQSHISGNYFEEQSESQVNSIIANYWDEETCPDRPQLDGNSYELDSDHYIIIEKCDG